MGNILISKLLLALLFLQRGTSSTHKNRISGIVNVTEFDTFCKKK